MDDVTFTEEQKFGKTRSGPATRTGGMTGWLIARGWARGEREASRLLLITAVILVAIAVFLVVSAVGFPSGSAVTSPDYVPPPQERLP